MNLDEARNNSLLYRVVLCVYANSYYRNCLIGAYSGENVCI